MQIEDSKSFGRALILLALPICVPAQADEVATKLFGQMAHAERNANYSATQTIARADSTVRVRVWRLGRKKRLEYLEPAINRGDVLLDDGQNTWLYHRAENAAIQTHSQNEREANVGKRTLRVADDSQIGGRKVSVVEILRAAKNGVARRIWIDKTTKLRLATQFFDEQNQSTGKISLDDLKVGGVSEARFRWSPPAGAQIVKTDGKLFSQMLPAKQAASWLETPSFVPRGFRFESAVVNNAQDKAWLRYSSASQRFSIFQQRAAAKADHATQKVEGGWYRVSNGSRLLIAGAPDNTAKRILESMK